ncbi:hypothetical protein FSP39_022998 [Pinctada imbricata]|uniref:Reverse transcriptase domain-containing protein n=1 Tax=Pinctada imbricata TaxID=66713 RepID=A0AA89BY67_PINIB|nr:hypothetical protein FSP39_022998 [Pinctada imbricata]
MESESHNQRLFYKLIKKQRSGPQMKLSRLFVNDVHLNTEDEIREGWAEYFEELSRPKIIETFDVEYKEQVETDKKCIQQTCEAQQDRSKLDLTHEHILEVVTKLKNGKSADENNITGESIKFGGSVLIDYLQILFGKIVSEKEIPEPFKCGIITPIYKKNNKPLEDPNSYRRITVSSIIGKIFEKIHLDSMESLLTSQQNDLQRGFTKNTSPVYAGLILTEALAEAMDTKQTLYAGFLNASKAFDVVWYDSMLRKLYIQGLEGTDWLLLKNWYTGMRSKVKWGGGYSSAFLESQGVRQGGIWSSTAYKMFINPALDLYETYHLGFKIGSVRLGSPTCADDELLLSTKYQELRTMVNIQETYANRERYTLSEAKSKVMVFNKMARTKEDIGYIELNNKELEIVDSYTHIGFHGYNGVNPKVSIKMWAMYVKPRMLYGLESQILKRKDIDAINHYHKKVIKQLMHLPQRTADAAVYILAGDIPIEGDLHIKILGQLGNIFRSNGVERKLAERQLAMKEGNSASWFIYAKSILERYDLPSIYDLSESPPAKTEWNALIRKKVVTTWIDKVTTEAKSKSTLRHLCKAPYKKGTVHNLWRYASDDTIAVKKAGVKAKLVTGSYTLQADHARFYQNDRSTTCTLCHNGVEDLYHFLLLCPALKIRDQFLEKILDFLANKGLGDMFRDNRPLLTQIILDPSSSVVPCILQSEDALNTLESLSRGLCYAIHSVRSNLLQIPL